MQVSRGPQTCTHECEETRVSLIVPLSERLVWVLSIGLAEGGTAVRNNKVLISVLVLAASVAVESAFLFGAVSSLRGGVDALVSEVSDKVNLSDLAASLESGRDVQQVLQNMDVSSEPDAVAGSSEPLPPEDSTESAMDAANIVSDGKSQLDLKRYDDAFASFSRAADLGDAEGTFYKGYCEYYGYGTTLSYDDAYRDFDRSAQLGSKDGLVWKGVCLYSGEGVDKDCEASYYCFEIEAEHGNPVALNGIGNCYKHGYVVDVDYGKMIDCYQRSADGGHVMGLVNLGACYYDGCGVPVDKAKAAALYQQAADMGSSLAQFYLAQSYYDGEGVERDLGKAKSLAEAAANNEHDPSASDDARAYLQSHSF